ncbi:MAG TPA: lysophospholipid acyltransferase family protein [Victivallales bacterium]|nr:lysophospholipid acyltransferase family protein [Victivallales bacterium]
MSKKKKSLFVQNVEYFFILIFIGIIRYLPLKIAFKFSVFFSNIAYILDGHHRKRTIQHLMHAGVAKDIVEAKKIAKKNFNHFGKIFVEIVKIDQYLTPENIHEHITWKYMNEGGEEALQNPKGVIFAGAHYGNWEVSGLGASALLRPMLSVMRPFDNKKLGDYIRSKRTMFNQDVCSKENAIKHLLKALRAGKAVGILSDQHASTAEGVETIFFGHPARTHFSAALLQMKTGASLVQGIARRLNDNFDYEFVISGPFKLDKTTGDKMKDLQILTQKFTTALEVQIKQQPEQWVWCHRRWLDINRKKKK